MYVCMYTHTYLYTNTQIAQKKDAKEIAVLQRSLARLGNVASHELDLLSSVSFHKRALCLRKRALYLYKRALHHNVASHELDLSSVAFSKRALFLRKRALYLYRRALHHNVASHELDLLSFLRFLKRALQLCKRAS